MQSQSASRKPKPKAKPSSVRAVAASGVLPDQKKKRPRKPRASKGSVPVGTIPNRGNLTKLTALVRATQIKSKHAQIAIDQLVNPATAPLMRIQAGGGSATLIKSALARLPARLHLDLTTLLSATTIPGGVPYFGLGDEAYPVWAATDDKDKYYQFIVTDDPLVPMIYPVKCSSADKVYSLAKWISGVQDLDGAITVMRNGGVATSDVPFNLPLGGNAWLNKNGDYGEAHPIGCNAEGTYYTWLDANAGSPVSVYLAGTFNYAAGITLKSVRVVAQVLTGSTESGAGRFVNVEVGPAGSPASGVLFSGNVSLPYSGYFAFYLQGLIDFPTAGAPQMVWFTPSTTTRFEYAVGVVSRHVTNRPLIEIGEGGSIAAIRTLGASALFTNVAPHLYKGGSVLAYSAASMSEFWFSRISEIPAIEQVSDQFYMRSEWERGVYAYVRPRSYGKVVEVKHERGALYSFNGDFADPWGWSVVMLQPSLGTATSAPMMIQHFTAIEFWTENPMFHLLPPEMSVEAFNIFLDTVAKLDKPFSCNPSHFQLIFEAIKAAARTAGHVLMPVFESGVRFTRALQSETPLSSALAELGA